MEENLPENSTVSVTCKDTMLKGSARRSSTGSTIPRSSPSHSSKDEKTVPHYLRASTGSCHDLCKYGHRNPLEEEERVRGWRKKKSHIQLNNSTLQRSAILDRSKDTKHRSLSLAKSSMSAAGADCIRQKATSLTWKDNASYKPAVPRATSSADRKSLTSDGRKKKPVIEPEASSNPRSSDRKSLSSDGQKAITAAQPKLVENNSSERPHALAKSRLVKQPLARPISSPLKPHMIKQMSGSNDASSKPLISSRDKCLPKGRLTSQPTASSHSGVQQNKNNKAGRTLKGSSMAEININRDMDMSGALISAECELTASVEIQDGEQAVLGSGPSEEKTFYVVEPESYEVSLDSLEHKLDDQQSSEPSSAAKECVQESRSAPEESSTSNSEDEGMETKKNNEASAGERHLESTEALEHSLQQSSPGREHESILTSDPESYEVSLNSSEEKSHYQQSSEPSSAAKECVQVSSTPNSEDEQVKMKQNDEASGVEDHLRSNIALGHSLKQSPPAQELESMSNTSVPEHKNAEQYIGNTEASKDEGDQPIDAVLCQLSKPAEDVDAPDSKLIEPSQDSVVADGAKVIGSEESPIIEGNREVVAHEDLQGLLERSRLAEKHGEKFFTGVGTPVAEGNGVVGAHEDIQGLQEPLILEKHGEEIISIWESPVAEGNGEVGDREDLQGPPVPFRLDEKNGKEFNSSEESPAAEGNRNAGDHENLQGSPEPLRLDEKHCQDLEPTLTKTNDRTSGKIVQSIRSDEGDADSIKSPATPGQPSELSAHDELLEEAKFVLSEPSDSNVQHGKVVIVRNNGDSFEGEETESRALQQSRELPDDEYTEESDFESSESYESVSENEGTESNINDDGSLKTEGRRPRRTSALLPDGTLAKPYKLKFKRGKVVELPTDSNGPRRLKFRKRVSNDIASSVAQQARRSYKRNEIDTTVPNDPNVEAPGVKLRHQDAQGKKDAQGLFNNVIEETASKLVESRKSKVKALVGAFETVISLQDGKPASSTPQAGNSQHPVHDDGENSHD